MMPEAAPRLLETIPHPVLGHWRCPNPLQLNSELNNFPETSIPWINPVAEMQNLAVLFCVHKFQTFDPFQMNGRAMNTSRLIHFCCTHEQAAQQQFC
jgi:hypothetical protein